MGDEYVVLHKDVHFMHRPLLHLSLPQFFLFITSIFTFVLFIIWWLVKIHDAKHRSGSIPPAELSPEELKSRVAELEVRIAELEEEKARVARASDDASVSVEVETIHKLEDRLGWYHFVYSMMIKSINI